MQNAHARCAVDGKGWRWWRRSGRLYGRNGGWLKGRGRRHGGRRGWIGCQHRIVSWPAVAEALLTDVLLRVVAGEAVVVHLKAVESKTVDAVAPLRARPSRERGCVQEQLHSSVLVKVCDEDLLHIGQRHVGLCVAREARVGLFCKPAVLRAGTSREQRGLAVGLRELPAVWHVVARIAALDGQWVGVLARLAVAATVPRVIVQYGAVDRLAARKRGKRPLVPEPRARCARVSAIGLVLAACVGLAVPRAAHAPRVESGIVVAIWCVLRPRSDACVRNVCWRRRRCYWWRRWRRGRRRWALYFVITSSDVVAWLPATPTIVNVRCAGAEIFAVIAAAKVRPGLVDTWALANPIACGSRIPSRVCILAAARLVLIFRGVSALISQPTNVDDGTDADARRRRGRRGRWRRGRRRRGRRWRGRRRGRVRGLWRGLWRRRRGRRRRGWCWR